jgi:CRP-like cAMP-binding protein
MVVFALYKDIIQKVPLFQSLEEEATTQMCTALRPMVATAGTTIFKEGDAATAIYFIIEGTVKVSVRDIKLGYLSDGGRLLELD